MLINHLHGNSTNCLHVGAGGRDTAGLGGKGGPYRLDAGHKVYQISQAEKDAVPDEVKRAAHEMGEKAFKQRYTHLSLSFITHSVQTQISPKSLHLTLRDLYPLA